MIGSLNSMSIIPISFHFLFLFIYNFEGILAAPIQHLCRPDQRDALLKFKNEITIGEPSSFCVDFGFKDPHPNTKSWTNNSDCCNWEGIICNAKSGKVMKLDLSCSCLRGQFHSNSSLLNLHSLTALNLAHNDFSGQIPSLIENFSQLTSINLTFNHFSGQIPSSIGKLTHLTSLDLSQNGFSGQIPSSVGNLSHLISLEFAVNGFVGPIPSSIGNLSHLTSLSFSANNFVGRIPSWIRNLFHLTSLILCENSFSGQIPFWIGNLSQLAILDLSSNQFVGQIPSSLGKLNQLTDLDIGSNDLSGEIPTELPNLTHLSSLSLSYNQLTGRLPTDNPFSGILPSSLFTLPSLIFLYLQGNQLHGILEFGNISSPSKLQYLGLGNNNFIGPFPSSISKLTNLESLDLSDLNTQGPIDFSLFSHLNSLTDLSLSRLNTTTTIELNGFLSYFKRISTLDFSDNLISVTNKSSISDPPSLLMETVRLSGCGITELPVFLRTQQRMRHIDISNNNIKGHVPSWLWTLPYLEHVNFSNNTFIAFENSMTNGQSVLKSSILYLFGSNNNITSELPSFICELGSLRTLDMSNNNFNGPIPRCMGNLERTLSDLNLRHNHLHGGLPENIFKSLRSLDVGHNQLVGKLPRSLIHFSALEVLNLESNKINDTFPFWLSSLQELKVLVLRSNAFHGLIHQISFPKLQIIDISHNHFTGTLPSDYFVKWSAMSSLGTNEDQSDEKYMGDSYYYDSMVLVNKGVEIELARILKIYTALDFSENKLKGEIPSSIGLLKELHVLNLSDNAFTGHIPLSMGNLTALESLDISQNHLSGRIPQELGSLSFLSYMNFSHNQLSGLVPGGTQFRTQNCSSFEYNMRLYGPSLDEVCKDIHTPTSEDSDSEEKDEDEEVISWIAVVVGFISGIAFGITLGHSFARKSRKTTTR